MKTFCALFLAACLAAPVRAADAPEIVLGMSTVLSGSAAHLGLEMRQGVRAGFERVNRAGGIQGRPLRLHALDDRYEPALTTGHVRHLIEREKVLALIGNVGTPTALAALPIAREQKTLFFAPFTGAAVLRPTPPDRYVINYRASYAQEIAAMIDGLIAAGLRVEDIALFTQRDTYGDAGFAEAIAALQRHGLADARRVPHVRYERNSLAVESALASLLYAEPLPRAVVMVGAYAPCAKFITLAQRHGLEALFLNVSFVGSQPLAAALGALPARVIVTQVVPHPLDRTVPLVCDYQADLAALEPPATPSFGGLEGYLAARLLTRALETIAGPPDRESVITALEALGTFDLGLGEPLTLSPTEHQASQRVWWTALRGGAFVPLTADGLGEMIPQKLPREGRP